MGKNGLLNSLVIIAAWRSQLEGSKFTHIIISPLKEEVRIERLPSSERYLVSALPKRANCLNLEALFVLRDYLTLHMEKQQCEMYALRID